MSKILWINNSGAGWADHVNVPEGTTVAKFVADKLPHFEPSDYLIRVNRMPVAKDQVLQDGDRVTCTPLKIEGASPVAPAA